MRLGRIGVVALVASAASAVPALGASETFRDPQWNFSGNNEPHLVYACDGSAADCSETGPRTTGAAEKAHVYCSDPNWNDKDGSLTWSRPGSSNAYLGFASFKTARHTGTEAFEKWASVPTSPEGYRTGTGGFIFTEINCGDFPLSTDEDVITARFSGTRTWERPRKPGETFMVKLFISGKLEISGVFGQPAILGDFRRRVLRAKFGNPSGNVRIVQTFRRCIDAACVVKRLFKRTSPYRMNALSKGAGLATNRGPRGQLRRLEVVGGRIPPTVPGCRRGFVQERLSALVEFKRLPRRGKETLHHKVQVNLCGEVLRIDTKKGHKANVSFRIRSTEPLFPTERQPSLARMG